MEFSLTFEQLPLLVDGSGIDILAYGIAEVFVHGYGKYEILSIRINGDAGDVEIKAGHVLWDMLAPQILSKCMRGLEAAHWHAVDNEYPLRQNYEQEHSLRKHEML